MVKLTIELLQSEQLRQEGSSNIRRVNEITTNQ